MQMAPFPDDQLVRAGNVPDSEVAPISYLGNHEFDGDSMALLRELLALPLPELVNPAKKYGPLIETPYWETFEQRPEFYSLVNAHLLPVHLYEVFQAFQKVVAPYVADLEEYTRRTFKLALPMMIRIKNPPARNHVDTPVRDFTINWHVFDNHDHEVYFGPQTIRPQTNDLFLFNVDYYHGTRHPSPEEVVFMSYSLRFA